MMKVTSLVKILPVWLVVCSVMSTPLPAQEQTALKDGQTYRYTQIERFQKTKPGPDLQYVYLAIPPCNEYQDISNMDVHGGEVFDNPGSDAQYVRYRIDEAAPGAWIEVTLSFDYTPHHAEFGPATIRNIRPYDTRSKLYTKYTGNYHQFININNPDIKRASQKLQRDAGNNPYVYAHACYEYVLNTFEFKSEGRGWLSTRDLIANHGGDCGNLSTLFITLARCGGVPARHVIAPNHVWAEFYLHGNGWVPVDPTYKLFGMAHSSYKKIIWANEILFSIDLGNGQLQRSAALSQHHVLVPSHNPYTCNTQVSYRSLN